MHILTENIGLFVTKDLKNKLENTANVNQRSLSYVIRTILEEYYEEEVK